MSALGYYVPGDAGAASTSSSSRSLEGYIWVFPRCGHLSVGICGKGEPAAVPAQAPGTLHGAKSGISWKGAAFYSHLLPSLETGAWKQEPRGRRRLDGGRRCRRAWWIRSPAKASTTPSAPADLAARALLAESAQLAEKPRALPPPAAPRFHRRPRVRLAPGQARLSWAASCSARVPARMVQFTRRSPRFSAVMQDLFAGTPALPGPEAPPAAQPERQPLRNRHEPRLQPAGAAQGRVAATAHRYDTLPIRSTLPPRPGTDSRRRQLARARLPQRGRQPRCSSPAARAPTSSTSTATSTSTTSAPGGRCCSATAIPRSWRRSSGALEIGTSFGAPTEQEIDLAEAICDAVPSIEMVRLVNSGTEATMSRHPPGPRLHRPRPHRQVRRLLPRPRRFAAGEGRLRHGHARHRRHAGVPQAFCDTTIALPFNSARRRRSRRSARTRRRIAAVIVEPVVGNMGCVPPRPGFLEAHARDHRPRTARC